MSILVPPFCWNYIYILLIWCVYPSDLQVRNLVFSILPKDTSANGRSAWKNLKILKYAYSVCQSDNSWSKMHQPVSLSTETPLKDVEDTASSSHLSSDLASSLFKYWGHDLGPESRRVALKKFRYYGYNGYLSDRMSLTRPIPDLRPDGSVSQSVHC